MADPAAGAPTGREAPNGRRDFRDRIATARWSFRLIWDESPGLLVSSLLITLLRGILPAALALVIKGLVDAVVLVMTEDGSTQALSPWLLAAFALALLEGLSWFANRYVTSRVRDDMEVRISKDVLSHATTLDLAFLEDPNNRDLIDRARANPGVRMAGLVTECQTTVAMVIQAVSLLGVLIVIEPMVLLVVPPFSLPFLVFQWRLAKQRYQEEHVRVTKRRWSNYYSGLATGPYVVPETRLLDLGPVLLDRYGTLLSDFRDRDHKLHKKNLVGSSVATFLVLAALYALFARVAFNAVTGAATIGDLAIFTGAAGRLRMALDAGIRAVSYALEHTLFLKNLELFLAARPSVIPGPERARWVTGGARLALENVSFTYPGSSLPVLSNISLEIRPGETVAIVGENGAGKSTLAKILARLYDPEHGRVRFNGVDLRDLRFEDFHSQVSFVFQSFGRYEGTVADNIALGNWRELLDKPDEIVRVAKEARIEGLVDQLPDGYETVLGRLFGEVTLSGGQWQQLAVARAYARDSSLVVLDEPTSNLDARAEFELFSRFKELAAERTTILISHRFSTIAMADRIVVLSDGRIEEMGTHEELLRQAGPYAALYSLHRRQLPEE